MTKAWLAEYNWSHIESLNQALCANKKALHKPTSDGFIPAKKLWESSFHRNLSLPEAVDICRRCHQFAPFCFYNGNTFVAVIKASISTLNLPEEESFTLRSLAGHIVAGTDEGEERQQFSLKCRQLDL